MQQSVYMAFPVTDRQNRNGLGLVPLHNVQSLCRQFAGVVLGLNCYHDLTVNRGGDEWVKNPEPEVLVAWLTEALQHGHLCALIDDGDSLITASGGDINITLYNPSPALLELVRQLATTAGLHLWQPQQLS